MILIVGTIRIPAGSLATARAAMADALTGSRAEPGCIEYVYAEDVLDSGLIHIKELWTDREALKAHPTTEHILRWRAAAPNLGISDRNLRMYEVGDPQPL